MVQTDGIRGVRNIIFAQLAFTVMICLVRLAQIDNGGVAALFRFSIGVISIVTMSFLGKTSLVFNDKRGLLLRGILGGTAIGLGFVGITKIGLIKASLLINTYPLFGTIFGIILLKEKVAKRTIVAMIVAFIGVLLVLSRGESFSIFMELDLFTVTTLAGAVLGGLAMVQVKKLTASESSSSIYLAQCLIGTFIMIIPAGSVPLVLSQRSLVILIVMGVFATIGQLCITEGIKHVQIATSSVLSMIAPTLTIAVGALLFKEPFTLKMGIGVTITLGAIFYMGLSKSSSKRNLVE